MSCLQRLRVFAACLAVMAAAPAGAAPLPPTAPTWSWLFDDGGGSALAAHTGGEDGVLTGNPVWDADTPFGGAGNTSLLFDGNDAVEVAGLASALNGLSSFTVSTWIRAGSTSLDAGFWSGQDLASTRGQDLFGARYDAAGWLSGNSTSSLIKLGVTLDQSGSIQSYQYESGENVQTTAWQHVAIVWESGVGLSLYVDGALDGPTQDETAGQVGDVAGQLSFVIGDGSKTGWQGRIDEFAVWDGALAVEEVEWLAANGLASLPVPEPASCGLVLLGLALLARRRRR